MTHFAFAMESNDKWTRRSFQDQQPNWAINITYSDDTMMKVTPVMREGSSHGNATASLRKREILALLYVPGLIVITLILEGENINNIIMKPFSIQLFVCQSQKSI